MELMQLEMFVALVDEGSVLRAAERVCRTQPAVSMALRKLEQEIGTPLFDRARRLEHLLTPAGDLFYEYATRLLALRAEAVAALAQLTRVSRGSLRVGTVESVGLYLLPRLTHAFHEQYPNVKLEVVSDHSEKLLREVKERRIDVALLANLPEGDELESRLIMRDRLVLIVGPRHRLAGSRSLHVRDLGEEQIISEGATCSLHDPVAEAFQRFRTPINVRIESTTIETIKKMVAAGLGVAFVPLMCVRGELARNELTLVDVEGLRDERTLWLVRRRSEAHSHASEAFTDVIASSADAMLREEGVAAEIQAEGKVPARGQVNG